MPRALPIRTAMMAVLAVAGPAFAAGELFGRVGGYVYDPTGAPLAEVPLTLKGSHLLQPQQRTSGEEGRFEFPEVPPGEDYSLEVTVPGFASIRQAKILVLLGQTTPVDVHLQVFTE